MLAEIERRAEHDDVRALERAGAEEHRHREEEDRLERERLKRIEEVRADRLLEQANRWRETSNVHAYVAALRECLAALDASEQRRLEEWCSWAEAWAQRADPLASPWHIVGLNSEEEAIGGHGLSRLR